MDISIIVPVYNVADYLRQSLDSMIAQEFSGQFVIKLIDDASTDSSGDICREYASNHAALIELYELSENAGVSMARNRGLDAIRSTYFLFVDPDDLLPPDALQTLFDAAEKESADIIKGNNSVFNTRQEKLSRYAVNHKETVRQSNILKVFFEHRKLRGHPWGKLFRTEPLGGVRFTPGVLMAQDLLYCSEVFAQARSLVLLNRVVYRYRNHESGSTGKKYETGAYLHWLDSVEKSGQFADTGAARKAHKKLQVRTLAQLAREATKLPPALASRVLPELLKRKQRWKIDWIHLLFLDRLGFRAVVQYLKLKKATKMIAPL